MIGDDTFWSQFETLGWKRKDVDFLIWPRASWFAIAPQRYVRWFITRDAIPKHERNLSQSEWKVSILGGKGEWSHAVAVVGHAGK
jgi:hypothetical protein